MRVSGSDTIRVLDRQVVQGVHGRRGCVCVCVESRAHERGEQQQQRLVTAALLNEAEKGLAMAPEARMAAVVHMLIGSCSRHRQ